MAGSVATLQSPTGSPNWQNGYDVLSNWLLPQILGNINDNHVLQPSVNEQLSPSARSLIASSNIEGFGRMTAPAVPSLTASSSSSSSSSTWSSSSETSSQLPERSTSFKTSTSASSSSGDSEPVVVDDVGLLPENFDDRNRTHEGEIRKVFQKLDQNNDGLVCAKDLIRFTGRLGFDMSEDDAKSLVKSVDHNKDGRLDFGEFYSLYESLNEKTIRSVETDEADDEDDTLLQAFQVFDKNGDGYITVLELQTVLRDLGLPEGKSLRCCERIIQRVSLKKKDRIDLGEFKAMMCCKRFQI